MSTRQKTRQSVFSSPGPTQALSITVRIAQHSVYSQTCGPSLLYDCINLIQVCATTQITIKERRLKKYFIFVCSHGAQMMFVSIFQFAMLQYCKEKNRKIVLCLFLWNIFKLGNPDLVIDLFYVRTRELFLQYNHSFINSPGHFSSKVSNLK